MFFELLQLLEKNNTKIWFIKNTDQSCGKLFIHMQLYRQIYEIVYNSKWNYRKSMIESLCSHYNMISGDIAVVFNTEKELILFMFIKKSNGQHIISCPTYEIDPTVAVFSNSINYNDNFPLGYWDL